MKRAISILLALILMTSAFALTSCKEDPELPPIGGDTSGDVQGGTQTPSGGDATDPVVEEYAPDPSAMFSGYVALGATSAAIQYDNLKITSTRMRQTIYENDFEGEEPLSSFTYKTAGGGSWGGDAAEWSLLPIETVEDDETVTTNNVLSFANADSTGAMALYGGSDWNLIQVSLRCLVAESGGAMRLYFGVQDENNYYVLDIGGGDNSTLTVKHVESGKESVDTFALPYMITYDEWFNVSITLHADTVSVYVKGVLIFEAYKEVDEANNLYGGIGFGTWSTDVSYDNVKVTKLDSGDVLYENDFENDTLSDDDYTAFISQSDGTWTTVSDGGDWHTDWTISDDTETNPDSTHGNVLKLDYTGSMSGAGIAVKEGIGNADWNNYILEFDARKDGGAEGYMIHFAIVEPTTTFIRWNQGGWGNTLSCYQVFENGSSTNTTQVSEVYTTGEWYHMTVVVANNSVYGYVNGVLTQCYTK